MTEDPSFEIPSRPRRRYPPTGGVEYEGETVFSLEPDEGVDGVEELIGRVLDAERYVRGDFFDLPAPVYLVRDGVVGTSLRVVVRERRVELHVLPHTEAAALEALYERLVDVSGVGWSVECHADSEA